MDVGPGREIRILPVLVTPDFNLWLAEWASMSSYAVFWRPSFDSLSVTALTGIPRACM